MWIIRAFSFFFLADGKIVQIFVFCNLRCLCPWGYGGGMRVAAWVIPLVGILAVFGLLGLRVSLLAVGCGRWWGNPVHELIMLLHGSLWLLALLRSLWEARDVSLLLMLVFLVVWVLLQWGEGAGFSGADTVAVPLVLHHGPCLGSTPCLLHHSSAYWGHRLSHRARELQLQAPSLSCFPYVFQYAPSKVPMHGSLRYSSVLSRGMLVEL